MSSRHKDPYPPSPPEFNCAENSENCSKKSAGNGRASVDDPNDTNPESLYKSEDYEPLLPTSESSGLSISKASMVERVLFGYPIY